VVRSDLVIFECFFLFQHWLISFNQWSLQWLFHLGHFETIVIDWLIFQYVNIGLSLLLCECWRKAEIERLQSELDSRSHQQQTAVLSSRDELTDDGDKLTRDQTDSGTESQQLIDTLKCHLQQAALAQQTTNMQLDAIKQVIVQLC